MQHQGECGDEGRKTQLGMYALGAMPVDESGQLETHLARCGPCLVASEELGRTVDYLSVLSPEEVRAIIDES